MCERTSSINTAKPLKEISELLRPVPVTANRDNKWYDCAVLLGVYSGAVIELLYGSGITKLKSDLFQESPLTRKTRAIYTFVTSHKLNEIV